MDPGDTLIFNFSQPVFDLTFVSGVMNTTENGKILSNNGTPTLTSNCPTDTQITGNAFNQIGPIASPLITVTFPGGATQMSIVCLPASTNGVFTVDLLDCINENAAPCETTNSITESACDSYTSPSGLSWTSSGIYMDTIPNAAGCDSVITVDLAINNSSTGVHQQIACDSYTWIDGVTYTSDNSTATYTLTNAAGCDSVVSLFLTINNSSTGVDQQVACGSYTWIDGVTYTSDNSSATFTLMNAAGCDSVVSLFLTINNVNVSVTQAGTMLTADETGAAYQWIDCETTMAISGETNQSYTATANGSYAVIVTKDGCTDTSACVAVSNVGIIENDFGGGLILYPNPTNGNFSVDLGEIYHQVTIRITDLNGKLIQSKSYQDGQLFKLNVEESVGVYLLQIEAEEKNAIVRLVKE